jgi:hypothetical protein
MNLVEFIKNYKIDTIIGLVETQESESSKVYKLSWAEKSSLDLGKQIVLIDKAETPKGRKKPKTIISASGLEDHLSYFSKIFGITPFDFLSQTDHASYLSKAKAVGITPHADDSAAILFLTQYCRMIVFGEPFSYGESTRYSVVNS